MSKLSDTPKGLTEAIHHLEHHLVEEDLREIRQNSEEEFSVGGHHGMGRWLRNQWGLWSGSELAEWFLERGIWHADDMSGIILTSFHRHLTGKRRKLGEQIQHYQDYWKDIGQDPEEMIDKTRENWKDMDAPE